MAPRGLAVADCNCRVGMATPERRGNPCSASAMRCGGRDAGIQRSRGPQLERNILAMDPIIEHDLGNIAEAPLLRHPKKQVDIFGGRQGMRTIHFIISWALVAFTAVHLFQVVVTGFRNNLRSIITGNYWVASEAAPLPVPMPVPETVVMSEIVSVPDKEPEKEKEMIQEVKPEKGSETEHEQG